jgi:hypothetical protein
LNIGQKTSMNSTSLLVSLETISIGALRNKFIEQIGDAKLQIPSNFTSNLTTNASISLRVNY